MMKVISILLLTVSYCHGDECLSREVKKDKIVCVCNAQYCDTIQVPTRTPSNQFSVYTSNKAGLRFDRKNYTFAVNQSETDGNVTISTSKKYQTIIGFGGAFTDSTGIHIKSLDKKVQNKLLDSYFSKNGIEYNMGRVPMGCSDFSTHGYTYDDNNGKIDKDLKNFKLAPEDLLYKIPFIKQAMKINSNLQLMASPWTAPTWMKTNHQYTGLGYIKDDMYQSWAHYFLKFLKAYEKKGVSYWAVTTGNEPHSVILGNITLPVVAWNNVTQATWIANNLGPTIRRSKFNKIKIMFLDDMRTYLPDYVVAAFNNTMAKQYVDGIAFHAYMDFESSPDGLDKTRQLYPTKFLMSTEGCITKALRDGEGVVELGSWTRAEYYILDIIKNINHFSTGWIDWNLALDLEGGPNYVNNPVDAPIIVNASAGEFYKNPMFYAMGHVSKFVPRGSVRIHVEINLPDNVLVTAFQKPDKGIVLVILNRLNTSVSLSVRTETNKVAQLELTPKSFSTVLYWY